MSCFGCGGTAYMNFWFKPAAGKRHQFDLCSVCHWPLCLCRNSLIGRLSTSLLAAVQSVGGHLMHSCRVWFSWRRAWNVPANLTQRSCYVIQHVSFGGVERCCECVQYMFTICTRGTQLKLQSNFKLVGAKKHFDMTDGFLMGAHGCCSNWSGAAVVAGLSVTTCACKNTVGTTHLCLQSGNLWGSIEKNGLR